MVDRSEADQSGGTFLAALSAILGVAAALLVISVPAGVWNYSAEGAVLLTGVVGAALAALLAFSSRRTGSNALNLMGLALGVIVLAIGTSMLLFGGFDVEFG